MQFTSRIKYVTVEYELFKTIIHSGSIWLRFLIRILDNLLAIFSSFDNSYELILDFFPDMCMITASIMFSDYLLNSLCLRFIFRDTKKYNVYRQILRIILILYWCVQLVICSAIFIREKDCDKYSDASYYINVAMCMLTTFL